MSNLMRDTLKRNLRTLRKGAGLNQGDLAAKSGVSRITICRIETGHRDPTTATLHRLADALGVEPARLLAAA